MQKKLFTVLCLAVLAISSLLAAGCGQDNGEGNKKVAVAFANSSASWQRNGETIKKTLEQDGFAVDLRFADTATQQAEQLAEQINDAPGCIVIGAVDSTALTDVLKEAKEKNIPIIAYDRLVMNTDAVSYYAAFDNEAVGEAMGEYFEAAMQLKNGAGPYTIEVFAGDPADNNAHLFFSGAMKILQPYLDKGQLVCPSGELTFDRVATKDWEPKNAQARMEKLLAAYYPGSAPAAVLSPNDGVAGGIQAAIESTGYSGPQPLLSGQDADPAAVEAIRKGKQTFTIQKDPELLTAKCVRMIKAVVEGTQPVINDLSTYNNGKITVPSYLCTPLIIDKDNLSLLK